MNPEMFTMMPVVGPDGVTEFKVMDDEFPRGGGGGARTSLKKYSALIPQEALADIDGGVSFLAKGGAVADMEMILRKVVKLKKNRVKPDPEADKNDRIRTAGKSLAEQTDSFALRMMWQNENNG